MNSKAITLSDGRKATIRKGVGKDLFKAQQIANEASEVLKILIAMLTKIDDKPVQVEELDEMPLEDVFAIMNAFGEINPLSINSLSSTSSDTVSPTQN